MTRRAPPAVSDPSQLGPRVASLREARGWSREELARAADCTRAYVHAIETGRQVPRWDVVLRLADALSCSLEDLRRG